MSEGDPDMWEGLDDSDPPGPGWLIAVVLGAIIWGAVFWLAGAF